HTLDALRRSGIVVDGADSMAAVAVALSAGTSTAAVLHARRRTPPGRPWRAEEQRAGHASDLCHGDCALARNTGALGMDEWTGRAARRSGGAGWRPEPVLHGHSRAALEGGRARGRLGRRDADRCGAVARARGLRERRRALARVGSPR